MAWINYLKFMIADYRFDCNFKIKNMLKKELKDLFVEMPKMVKDKLKPVMDNLLERAEDLDNHQDKDSEEFETEREDILKEVRKVKYINEQWQIMNARNNN